MEKREESMYDEAPQMLDRPLVAADRDPEELDPAILELTLAVGAAILQAIAQGQVDELRQFVDEVERGMKRNKNLMRLLELESDELERLIRGDSESNPAAGATNPPMPAPSPQDVVDERVAIKRAVVESPKGTGGRNGGGRRLRDYLGM